MNESDDYHDYVFKDGRLVGEFEEMYRNSRSVPWHQDEQAGWIDVRLAKEIIRDSCHELNQIHDLGCGTGHYLNLISEEFLASGGKSYGYDISETACSIAASLFPDSEFSVLDLTSPEPQMSFRQQNDERNRNRLFMIRGTLWYVYPHIAVVVRNIRNMMDSHEKLLVVQNFPPLDSNFVGKDVIADHLSLIAHFSRCFSVERYVWYEDRLGTSNDNWFIGIFSPDC